MLNRALFAALALAIAAPAQAATWEVDNAHSTVGFVVKHLIIAKVRGHFSTFSGTVVIDDKDITKSKVDVKIDPASIDTDNTKRDEHLKSADFFDTAKFKDMTFKSTKVEKMGDGKLKMTGDLTMHGVTKSVVLEGEGPSAEVKDPGGNPHVAFSMATTIKRADFGLGWNKAIEGGGVVGEDVKLELEIELKGKK
ncbi:MAG: YceI family protein [Deltaproteobacteria bacterium]|nr:YceI family protein [Deltaproteobacteria bacterium]